MKKKLINVGDSVVFAQRYLNSEPNHRLYNQRGLVIESDIQNTKVSFGAQLGTLDVPTKDLELHTFIDSSNRLEPSTAAHLFEDHELGGYTRSQLIANSLSAQETDPELHLEINQLLTQYT